MEIIIYLAILGGIGYLVYRAYMNRGKLKRGKISKYRVLDQWATLVAGGDGKWEAFAKEVERAAEETAVPHIKLERKEISLGGFSFLKGTRKLIVAESDYFKGYRVFIGARDYGKQLNVSWFLTLEQSFLGRLATIAAQHWIAGLAFLPFLVIARLLHLGKGHIVPEAMDIFETEELQAFASTIHVFVKTATEKIMVELNQDFSKVNTKSRGMINIS